MIDRIRSFFELRGFEVCSRLGERLKIKPSRIRLFFIYSSFLALGSPFIIYLIMAFLIKIKDYTYSRRTSIFDL